MKINRNECNYLTKKQRIIMLKVLIKSFQNNFIPVIWRVDTVDWDIELKSIKKLERWMKDESYTFLY